MTDERLASSMLAMALHRLAECGVQEARAAASLRDAFEDFGHSLGASAEGQFYAQMARDCEELVEADLAGARAMAKKLSTFRYAGRSDDLLNMIDATQL